MHPTEIELVKKYLPDNATVMEWGSGGSTLEFSKTARKYYSVEHNYDWYWKMKQQIPSNVQLFYKPNKPQPDNYHQSEYKHYTEYLDVVYQIGEMFDFCLIDGRARRLCAIKVLPYLKPDAVVVIHDYCLRACYHCVTDYYEEIDRIDNTLQTIAAFKLRPDWYERSKTKYDINLTTFERLEG